MYLCYFNPQLLIYANAWGLMEKQLRKKNNSGQTALLQIFDSIYVTKADFTTENFKQLWNAEKDISDDQGCSPWSLIRSKPDVFQRL